MKKINDKNINKYWQKLFILFVILIILLSALIVLQIINKNNLRELKTETFNTKYDSSWKAKKINNNEVNFKHDKNITLDLKTIKLEDEDKYLEISSYITDFINEIAKQNKDYKLIAQEEDKFTKNNYDGYKLLYEKEDNQVIVSIFKKTDYIIIFTYEAPTKYFDIVLDSAENIIYNFDINSPNMELSYKLEIKENKIEWNKNSELDKNLKDNSSYKVANNNYLVNFSIPNNFKLTSINSKLPQFSYNIAKGNLYLDATVYNENIYDYISAEGTLNSNYKYIKNNKDYKNFKEGLEEGKDKNLFYIYKNSYEFSNSKYEECVLIYELDNSHIFVVKIKATNTTISRDLVDKIKLEKQKNYSSYSENKKIDDMLISTLKKFSDNNHQKITYVDIKLPTKYKELDKSLNIYENKNFGLNYQDDRDYVYEVEYAFRINEESAISLGTTNIDYYKNRNNFKGLSYKEEVTLNNKQFKVYEAGYNDYTNNLFASNKKEYYTDVKYLIYNQDNIWISILIKGKGEDVTSEILNDISNFDINIK